MQQKDREFAERLKEFDAVWKRVSGAKTAPSCANRTGMKLMPGKNAKKGCGRYNGGVKGR
jgi:hypothetical protein